jgi:hypothetical protein
MTNGLLVSGKKYHREISFAKRLSMIFLTSGSSEVVINVDIVYLSLYFEIFGI